MTKKIERLLFKKLLEYKEEGNLMYKDGDITKANKIY